MATLAHAIGTWLTMTGHDQHEEYLTEEEASSILNRSPRQVRRYGRTGKVGVQEGPAGRRYRRTDVEALALALQDKDRTRPARADLIPLGDVLDHLERKDAEIKELNERLQRAMLEIGRLQATIEHQQRLLTTEQPAEEPAKDQPSWWQRLRRRWQGKQ
jgi:hypothetical protein